ncbi:hypothetical protein K474DRAFT_1661731 [Panus rudis PR-1116 ss-1]|nr:hypothetical protein K474DRAFT_1661731 [Panus rudis PR-1116 ss-1]
MFQSTLPSGRRAFSEPTGAGANSLKRQRTASRKKGPKLMQVGNVIVLTCGTEDDDDGNPYVLDSLRPPPGIFDNLEMQGLLVNKFEFSPSWEYHELESAFRGRFPHVFHYFDKLPPRPDGKQHWLLGFQDHHRVMLNFVNKPNGRSATNAAGRRTISERVLYIASREEIPRTILREWQSDAKSYKAGSGAGQKLEVSSLFLDGATTDSDEQEILASPSTWTRRLDKGKGRMVIRDSDDDHHDEPRPSPSQAFVVDGDRDPIETESTLSELDSTGSGSESAAVDQSIKSPPRKVQKTYAGITRKAGMRPARPNLKPRPKPRPFPLRVSDNDFDLNTAGTAGASGASNTDSGHSDEPLTVTSTAGTSTGGPSTGRRAHAETSHTRTLRPRKGQHALSKINSGVVDLTIDSEDASAESGSESDSSETGHSLPGNVTAEPAQPAQVSTIASTSNPSHTGPSSLINSSAFQLLSMDTDPFLDDPWDNRGGDLLRKLKF